MPAITFYSKMPGLKCWAGKTKYESVDGTLRLMDPPLVQFTPIPSKNFGYFTTEDPAIIEYLENRMKTSRDVVSEEEFAKAVVPAEMQVKTLEAKNRELEQENRLLKQMKEQEATQAAAQSRTLPKPKPQE